MNRSISKKLFLWISGLGIFFISLSLVFSTSFLEHYYISQKKALLLESAQTIAQIYRGDPEAIQWELKAAESSLGGYIMVIDPEGRVKHSSFFELPGADRPPRPMPFRFLRPNNDLAEQYQFSVENDQRFNTNFLTLQYRLPDQDQLAFVVPLSAVAQNVAIANRFFLFTGFAVIGFSLFLSYFFSRTFTRPILAINGIARRMAEMDFSQKCAEERLDEVGELGRSINYLSNQLEGAIQELQQKNLQLQEDIEREKRVDEMRKEFITSVSHELKTPLALIQGYAEGLKVNVNQDEENKDLYCDVIIDETRRMDAMVKDLLNLCRLESGPGQIQREVFDLSLLVAEVAEKFRPVLNESGIQLSVEAEPAILVDADPTGIERVLVNYLSNAIRHVDAKRKIKISVSSQAEQARLGVFNSGKPIPEEYLDRIWSSFFKVDRARTREGGGTGLGLAIVRGILEQHGNRYGVENKLEGVEFWCEVDLAARNMKSNDNQSVTKL